MQIVSLRETDEDLIQQLAQLLFESFQENWPEAWPTLEDALQEVRNSLEPGRLSRVVVDETGTVLGWIGGIQQYEGNVWELHPLVVKTGYRRQGIGRLLVRDLEQQVKEQGGLTLWVGTDDESGQTSLSGVNLYPNIWEHVLNIQNLHNHPYEFYLKMGFTIVGLMPDANGIGKPDIYLAKRVNES